MHVGSGIRVKRTVGIWDLTRSGGSLGTLLILLEELEIRRQLSRSDAVDVVIVGDAIQLINDAPSERTYAPDGFLLPGVARLAPLIAVVRAMSGVTGCHVCSDARAVHHVRSLIGSNCVVWPDLELLMGGKHDYDSTRNIQDHFTRAGTIPHLSVGAALLAWAKNYLNEKAQEKLPVAVHLKNNPNVSGQSNANIDSWLVFMAACQCEFKVHFVLVGDDPADVRFRSLRNATIARDDGVTLDRHLAIIQAAGLFVGMMSGPANMALFGTNPYLIFKNPDHHALEMAKELGEGDRYPFALSHQRVLRMWDTTENLSSVFEGVFKQVFA